MGWTSEHEMLADAGIVPSAGEGPFECDVGLFVGAAFHWLAAGSKVH